MKLKPPNLSLPKFLKIHHSSTGIKRTETQEEQSVFQSEQTINTRTNAYCNMRPRKCLESGNVGISKQAHTPWVNHIMYISRKVIIIKRFSVTLKREHMPTLRLPQGNCYLSVSFLKTIIP